MYFSRANFVGFPLFALIKVCPGSTLDFQYKGGGRFFEDLYTGNPINRKRGEKESIKHKNIYAAVAKSAVSSNVVSSLVGAKPLYVPRLTRAITDIPWASGVAVVGGLASCGACIVTAAAGSSSSTVNTSCLPAPASGRTGIIA